MTCLCKLELFYSQVIQPFSAMNPIMADLYNPWIIWPLHHAWVGLLTTGTLSGRTFYFSFFFYHRCSWLTFQPDTAHVQVCIVKVHSRTIDYDTSWSSRQFSDCVAMQCMIIQKNYFWWNFYLLIIKAKGAD